MDAILSLLGLVGPAAMIVALIVIALLTQRLGAVTKRTPLYRWFFLSAALVSVGIVWRIFGLIVPDMPMRDTDGVLFYDLPLALGLVIAVVVAWRYWSWLLSERGKGA